MCHIIGHIAPEAEQNRKAKDVDNIKTPVFLSTNISSEKLFIFFNAEQFVN